MRVWTTLGATALAMALIGCAEEKPVKVVDASLLDPDCYTVDPYQEIRIAEPTGDVPSDMRPFLGAWGGGAWDGQICHDLWIMEIDGEGMALMFDAHAPGFHPDATAFTRRGNIGDDGRLRVRKGPARVEYWIEDGRLYGERKQGTRVQRIILTRQS